MEAAGRQDSPSGTVHDGAADSREALSTGNANNLNTEHRLSQHGQRPSSIGTAMANSIHRRPSATESLRTVPPSPRQRHSSMTQGAVQDLVNFPPSAHRHPNSKFSGREWRDVTLGEIVSPHDVKWIELDTTVEEATMSLLRTPTNVVLIRKDRNSSLAVSSFDYSDLNAYLLVVVGLVKPEPDQVVLFNDILEKVNRHAKLTVRDIQPLCRKEVLATVPKSGSLAQAIEVLGSGIHQILVTGHDGGVMGIVSQLRLIEFFWNEGVNFPSIDRLYPVILRDLGIGEKQTISVNADSPLSEALKLMHDEGFTSVPVVDNGQNVVGNISSKDVRHLTSSSSAPLLGESCMHFISIILSERGVENGQDAVPVFYVNPFSTLAHTVAKLVATGSHRMWIVDSASPSPSAPATPLTGTTPSSTEGVLSGGQPTSPMPSNAVPASALAGANISGRLTGVISLTDILNMFAKFTGLHPSDPGEARARRRRSSSSSVRPSLDGSRTSVDMRR